MPDPETARISVDFSRWVDYPLVKSKIALYNSGYVPGALETYRRDAHLMDELRPGSLRFDGGLGSPPGIILSDPPLLSGEPPRLKFDFRQADALVDLLAEHDVRPYWCYSYVPPALSSGQPDFRNPPRDMDEWARALAAVAGHFRRTGRQIAFHEIYNEPDNRDFFRGSLNDYLAMYEHGAKAIRAADPDARVGGPSLAFTESWIRPFLEHVTRNSLPLDFFSFHFYPGVPYSAKDVRGVVKMVRRELGRYPQLATAEMHLNEFNSLPINYPEDGPQERHALAADLLNDFAYFASQPSLTSIHWAQFMDTGGGNWSGLVTIDGHRKAAFNALAIYARMPVDRRKVDIDAPDGIGAMASSDEHTCAAVVWNRGSSARTVRMEMNGVPFRTGDLRVYRIDDGHASWGDGSEREELAAVEERPGCAMKDAVWEGTVPSGGVLYIEADDGSGISGLARCEAGRVLHVLHHYPDRNSPSYADFDRQTWTARLGMAGDGRGRAEVGVLAEGLPAELDVAVEMDGEMSPGGLLGVRLDYLSDDGWKSSVLFHGRADGGDTGLALPWGTRRKADREVRVPDFSRFRIRPGEYAPEGWTGRVLMTFLMQRAGTDTRAKITVRRSE